MRGLVRGFSRIRYVICVNLRSICVDLRLVPRTRSVIIYLPIRLLSGSSELLLTEHWYVFPIFCFVLAPNKDLAVSGLHYCKHYPNVDTLAFRPWRFCSHLAPYGGRLLAAIFLSRPSLKINGWREGVRTFLSLISQRAITRPAKTILWYHFKGSLSNLKIVTPHAPTVIARSPDRDRDDAAISVCRNSCPKITEIASSSTHSSQ